MPMAGDEGLPEKGFGRRRPGSREHVPDLFRSAQVGHCADDLHLGHLRAAGGQTIGHGLTTG